METLYEMNFSQTNGIMFVCRNKPSLSFPLDLRDQSFISLEINDMFEMGCEQFRRLSPMYQINTQTMYNQHGTDYSDKLERAFMETAFQFNGVKFDAIEKMIELTIQDETKEKPTTFKMSISPFKTNADLIKQIKEKMKISQTTVILVEKGKQTIVKKDSPLNKSNIKDQDVLTVNFIQEEPIELVYEGKPEACDASTKPFVDLENKDSIQKLGFSKDAPPYRYCRKGLNIEGTCKNPKCDYRGKLQISPQGFGPKEIIQQIYEDVRCVNKSCQLPIEIVTCGFYDCLFDWRGLKLEGGKFKKVSAKKQESEPGCYIRYNPKKDDGSANVANWMQLWIDAKPRDKICSLCDKSIFLGDDISLKGCSNSENHLVHKSCKKEFETQGNEHPLNCLECSRT